MEVRVDDDGDTYRTMYTTEMEGVVYVLDVFKKKSKAGIATPQADIDRLLVGLKAARKHFTNAELDTA
jgi:phage-related protein